MFIYLQIDKKKKNKIFIYALFLYLKGALLYNNPQAVFFVFEKANIIKKI